MAKSKKNIVSEVSKKFDIDEFNKAAMQLEQHFFSHIFTYPETLVDFIGKIHEDHFYVDFHKKLYKKMVDDFHKNVLPNPVHLNSTFYNCADLNDVGGFINYVTSLVEGLIFKIEDVDEFKESVEFYKRCRDYYDLSQEIPNLLANSNTADQLVNHLEYATNSLNKESNNSTQMTASHVLKLASESAEIIIKTGKKLSGVSCGLTEIDRFANGFVNGEVTVLAGRPAMGKTALALSMTSSVAARMEGHVLFFSFEMNFNQLGQRLLSVLTRIPSHRIRCGDLSQEESSIINECSVNNHDLPILFYETTVGTLDKIKKTIRIASLKNNIDLVVIDYLQLINLDRHSESRTAEITVISRAMKEIALTNNVPVLVLSQLSRAVESRADKLPQLSDLRDSGSIEQDADIVMFIHREAYYHAQKTPLDKQSKEYIDWRAHMVKIHNQASVLIAKNRHGPTGIANVGFDHKTINFFNL